MTRYPREVDREYLSCRSGGLNKIQVIDGGTPDLHQDLVACDRRRWYIVEHQLPTVFQQSDSFHASSPLVCPVGVARVGASEFRTCRSCWRQGRSARTVSSMRHLLSKCGMPVRLCADPTDV